MCSCEDRPCCGCWAEEVSQEDQHEAWLEQSGDFAGVVQDEEGEEDAGGFDDFETQQQCEDAYLDSMYEDRYESGDFD